VTTPQPGWSYLRSYAVGRWHDLSPNEARALTDSIKQSAERLFALLYEAHERKAWEALGYPSFKRYVEVEFDMTRQRAYQLLDQARVVAEISAAATTAVDIPEAAARDLKPVLGELTQRLRERIAAAPPEDAKRITEDVISDARRWREADLRDQRRQRRSRERSGLRLSKPAPDPIGPADAHLVPDTSPDATWAIVVQAVEELAEWAVEMPLTDRPAGTLRELADEIAPLRQALTDLEADLHLALSAEELGSL
jgi:hypothetical protein